jgi:diaminopimelate decarboxylase
VLLPLLKEVTDNLRFDIRYLNLGGGFEPGVTGYNGDIPLIMDFVKRKMGLKSSLDRMRSVPSIESIAESITTSLRRSLADLKEPTLIMEPGRFVVGPSGLLLLKVDHTKIAGGYKWVVVDGGTNVLPSISERRTVLIANNARESRKELVNIVGPLLYPKDFVAIKTVISKVQENDIVVVTDCGAYSLSSSTQFLYPRPAAVLITSNGKTEVIRERETFDDVLSKNRLQSLG